MRTLLFSLLTLVSTAPARAGSLGAPGGMLAAAVALEDKIFRSAFELYTLTITNYLGWCSVIVDGGQSSTASSISKDYFDGALSFLHAEPVQPFVWGYWTGTDGDTGSGDTSQDASVTMTADRAVLACCPISGDTCH